MDSVIPPELASLRPDVTPASAALAFHTLTLERVEIDRDPIYRLLRLQPDRPAHKRWIDTVEQVAQDSRRLLRPRGMFRIDAVSSLETRRIALASGASFNGAIGAFLKHSTLMATYVATIGSALERLSRAWLKAGKVMQGTVADAIASESVESTAQQVQNAVRAWAHERGMEITPPYSPGYCGMTVREQVPLFASLPAASINVRITPSCLMVPVKSISGLIGIGPADKVTPEGYPCAACNHPDCMQRRVPFDTTRGLPQNWAEAG